VKSLNILGIETSGGFRTIELLHGDVCDLAPEVDILAVSAFAGSYHPFPGSIIGALRTRFGIDCDQLERSPAIDLRPALGIWLSTPLQDGPARRLLFVEIVGGELDFDEALANVFASLSLIEAKGLPVARVALPLLGAGLQGLEPHATSGTLVSAAKGFLDRSRAARALLIVEQDRERADAIAAALDDVLGRVSAFLPQEAFSSALRADVRSRLLRADNLFSGQSIQLRDDWLRILSDAQLRSFELGVHGRKLVEHLLNRLGAPSRNLVERIRWIEQEAIAAPWICGYMNVLRHLGNESAHELPRSVQRTPASIGPQDLVAGLVCVDRLLEFWSTHNSRPTG
jgi:hypothetical protein